MIIDCHTHIFPEAVIKNRDEFCKIDEAFSTIYKDPKSRLIGVEDLINAMDESGVDKSVICGFSWNSPELCRLHNQYLIESALKYSGRLIAFITFSFSDPDWSEKELEQRLKEGAKGVGEIAFYTQEMTSHHISLIRSILEMMESLRLPILIHTNEIIGHVYPGKGRTPLEKFYELIQRFPNLPIILAHWGGGLAIYELMPEVKRVMKNVYYDTAASPFLYSKKIYKLVSEMAGVNKILFGSDYPLIKPKRYFQEIEEAEISEEDRKKILGLNFLRVLNQILP